jgi:hypothetical protein
MLSLEGQNWIEENFDRLVKILGVEGTVQAPRKRRSSKLASDARASSVFRSWEETGEIPAEAWIVAQFLGCSLDSAASVWSRRIEALRSAAYSAGDDQLLAFIESLSRIGMERIERGE